MTEPQSPFLPDTVVQFAWDSTSLGWLKTCPRLYQYSMLEHRQAKNESPHLRFGIEYHQALQDYDISRTLGIKHEDAVHDVIRALLTRTADWKTDHKTKNKECLIRTVVWYFEHFKDDQLETYVLDNNKAAVEVSFRFELDWGPALELQQSLSDTARDHDGERPFQPFLLCGHLDKIVRYNSELYVMDHKTTTTTPGDYFFDQFHPNNQMTLYTVAGQVVLKAPIRGVIIDAAQVAVGFSRFVRGFTYRTPDQLEDWLTDLRFWFKLAESYAEANYWPMNDTACDKFGGCKFRGICSAAPQVRENFLKSQFTIGEQWNPLKPR